MTTYGVTSTGFVYPNLDDIVADIGASLQASLGSGINLVAPSVFSQIVGIVAAREFSVWEAAAAVYNSQYPNTASGQSLDNVCSITGTTRLQATYGTVTLTVNLDAGVTLPAGKIVSAGPNTAQWATLVPVTNGGGAPADVDVAAQCTEIGPIPALAGTLTTIETPYSGWNSSTNASGADPGRDMETDPELRTRRTDMLSLQGSSSVDALRSALLQLTGVLGAYVFRNGSDVTDPDGVPPHAVECVVHADAGYDQSVRECIWDNLAAGIRAYGTTLGTITDSQGFTQQIDFTHAAEIPIYATVELAKDSEYPGDAFVKQAIADFINDLTIGEDVYDTQLYSPIFGVGGVVDVTKLWISKTSPPTGPGNIVIGSRERATCITANVGVTST